MKVITEEALKESLFNKIYENSVNRKSDHLGNYENWCILGEEINEAISDIFDEQEIERRKWFTIETTPLYWDLKEKLDEAYRAIKEYEKMMDKKGE